MISLLVVDDHPIVRDGILAVLGTQNDIRVVRAVAQIDDLPPMAPPDAVLLDWEIPGRSGAAAIEALKARFPRARIVVFSAHGGEERVATALQAGAGAYVLKGSPAGELIGAIRSVAAGGTFLGAGIDAPFSRAAARPTSRELEVLRLAERGFTNAQIAQHLHIAERTVKFHLSSVFRRLGATRRTEAIALARKTGLL